MLQEQKLDSMVMNVKCTWERCTGKGLVVLVTLAPVSTKMNSRACCALVVVLE